MDIVDMARAAEKDERPSDGALYGKLANEIERLRATLASIQHATTKGRVCDDVAWFDKITTLYDFCEQSLEVSCADLGVTS